eukprot:CAMPEP_0172947046 /NCGR_PEP_ID=MMETSP1075-20121228/227371_1 /TAXON_ID=2916 /ORGANISM="Ceratium fusus, Strain PA161109" /LENGTH=79 /DNA_ID=CAMNT_0013808513 /DNA_START=736 /DNA_END=975 /DNA_ORIENTATION=-
MKNHNLERVHAREKPRSSRVLPATLKGPSSAHVAIGTCSNANRKRTAMREEAGGTHRPAAQRASPNRLRPASANANESK